MINLIPTEEKKEMRNVFLVRLLVVFFTMLGITFLVASVAMLPSFILSYGKQNSVNQKLKIQKEEEMPAVDQRAQIAIKDLNSRLGSIEKSMSDKYVFSQKIVGEIISKKIAGIKIKRIYYDNNKDKGKTVIISGVAESREVLLSFRRAFEDSGTFKNVDLPISNFVKGHNIEFSLNLTAI